MQAYLGRSIAVALCQGAGLHFIDVRNGVKDFDVWTFFAVDPEVPFRLWRRIGRKDFGASKFVRHPSESSLFLGRRVDLLFRTLSCGVDANPVEVLRQYLSQPPTESARQLSKKGVVLLEPAHLRGYAHLADALTKPVTALRKRRRQGACRATPASPRLCCRLLHDELHRS